MISILEAIQKADRAHDSAMKKLREWECTQRERIEREFREREERRKRCLDKFQRQIDDTIRAHREQAARDKLEIDALLAEAEAALIKRVSSKRTRI